MGFFKKLKDKVTAPKVALDLRLEKFSFALGEDLVGTLNLSVQEDFECTEIRCEINCTEQARVIRYVYDPNIKRNVPQEVTETRVLFAAKPTLNGPTRLITGENRVCKLKMPIPTGAKPTFNGGNNTVSWTVKGVIAVDGRPDATSQTFDIQVLMPTIQTASAGQTVVKEVVVVKIPCSYCQTLFDQLETTCPHCGAKRKG
jgi:hypothetical protein